MRKSLTSLIKFSFIILLLSHGAYNALINNIVVNVLTLVIITFLIAKYYAFKTEKRFDVFLIYYILCHFSILNKWGGLYVLSVFIIMMYLLDKSPKIFGFNKDLYSFIMIAIFLITNIIGIVLKNEGFVGWKTLGFVGLLSYLLTFYYIKNQQLDKLKVNKFIKLVCLIAVYQCIISINCFLGLIDTKLTHLIPTGEKRFGSLFMAGTFGHSELFGEYAMLTFLLLLPFAFNVNYDKKGKKKKYYIIIGLLCSLINLLLSASRSAFILLIIGIFTFFLLSNISSVKIRLSRVILYSFLVVTSLYFVWQPLKLNYVLDRLKVEKGRSPTINIEELDIITGKGTPRELAFKYFFERYNNGSWWIGYGFSTPQVNHYSWFGDPKIRRTDYHSLYLSIIILYGYIGSIAYISLFVITLCRLAREIIRKNDKQLNSYAISFFLVILFLLLNQYKISLLRMPHYHMLTWMWLGIANAIVEFIKRNNFENTMVCIIPIAKT